MTIGMVPSIVGLVIALLATAIGQLLFKLHYQRPGNRYLYGALGTFILIPPVTYVALVNISLAAVYMSTALSNVLVLVMSRVVLKERISRRHAMAATLIIVGIMVFNL